ncbi:hypothetical protein JJQ59_35170 (plasmid) [Cupriavidus necator]|uniref:hypothetical protein n=1 Tax=Cupriavidus necator TaxID=106590 RepID=UPI00167666C4|nr:hypothetical protein [Cupriavidus necator]QQX89763.1 hypothetical protein JJQ59_35170 [Cupriavidus necator]
MGFAIFQNLEVAHPFIDFFGDLPIVSASLPPILPPRTELRGGRDSKKIRHIFAKPLI